MDHIPLETESLKLPMDCALPITRRTSRIMTKSRTPIQGDTIGERVTNAMVRKGLTKAELARRVGISWQSLHHIVTDRSAPKLQTAKNIATVLGVTVEEILGLAEGQEPGTAAWGQFKQTSEYQSASPEERRAVAAIMWPQGKEPTLSSYLLALQAVRAAREKGGRDGEKGGSDRHGSDGDSRMR